MEKFPIKIPASRARRSWQIQIPEGVNEREAMADYAAYGALLESLGFEKVSEVRSLSHQSMAYRNEGPVESYTIWNHPAGLIGYSRSYTGGGYTQTDGTFVPVTQALGSFHVEMRMDIGTGSELQHAAAVGLSGGSGGVMVQLDGSQVRELSLNLHSNADTLLNRLESIQRHGRFLPLSKWKDIGKEDWFYLPPELALPLLEIPGGKKLDDYKEIYALHDMNEKWASFFDTLPEGVGEFLRWCGENKRRSEEKSASGVSRNGLRWDPVEFSVKRYSEALFFAGKRWRGSYDGALLDLWSKVAMGEEGETVDPIAWRAYEKGPGGTNLPVAMLYTKSNRSMPEQLLELLEKAPLAVLRRWATEPDAAGYTLGLHAVNRVLVEGTLPSYHAPEGLVEGVLDVLYSRLGAAGLPMATQTRSVMGLPLQLKEEKWGKPENALRIQSEFSDLILKFEGWGLPWNQDLRWRNYPNLFQATEGKPFFFKEDGPINGDEWLSRFQGVVATEGLKKIKAFFHHRQLDEKLSPGTSRAVRIRM